MLGTLSTAGKLLEDRDFVLHAFVLFGFAACSLKA